MKDKDLNCSEMIKEGKWDQIRAIRTANLKNTDWIVINSQEVGDVISEEWKTYRKKLRDIPQTFDDPDAVIWPKEPTN